MKQINLIYYSVFFLWYCGCRTKFGKFASYIFYHSVSKDKTNSPQMKRLSQHFRLAVRGEKIKNNAGSKQNFLVICLLLWQN